MRAEFLFHADEGPLRRLLLAPLVPASGLFGALAAVRRMRWAGRQERAPIPVISVGNLAVGGAGKTPVTLELARRLQRRGLEVAILSRGYGGRGKGARFVSRGGEPLLGALDAGDEPVLLARRLPGAMVLVGTRRAELARLAAGAGADVALLDDGFQHLQLARELDVVVLDGASPFGNGRLLPRGPLREGKRALRRAHVGWISKVDEGDPAAIEAAAADVLRLTGAEAIRSRYAIAGLLGLDLRTERPLSELQRGPVLMLAGVARPGSFRRSLARAGAKIAAEALFPDHHAFTQAELEGVLSRARAEGAELVVCTEKDAVRLPPDLRGAERIVALRVETELVAGGETIERELDRALTGGRRG